MEAALIVKCRFSNFLAFEGLAVSNSPMPLHLENQI